jgi:hypothetical protein
VKAVKDNEAFMGFPDKATKVVGSLKSPQKKNQKWERL